MRNVILQPTGNKTARKHYNDTVMNPVSLDDLKAYMEEALCSKIASIYPGGKIPVWGVTNGKNNINKNKWERIKPKDIVLFARDKKIYTSAVVTFVFRNKELAKYLWNTDANGKLWENIYLVDELRAQDITYMEFNKIVGYKEGNVIQGFGYLDEEKSNKILEKLDSVNDTYWEDVSRDVYNREVERLMNEENLDRQGSRSMRKEQGYLRKVLFGENTEYTCGICGKRYPLDLLITAHIKKRSECSKEERLDTEHIVMPMCRLGCDDLYEKGYILVEGGKIKENQKKRMTSYVEDYLKVIEGRQCEYWNEKTQKYFEAHNQKFIDG